MKQQDKPGRSPTARVFDTGGVQMKQQSGIRADGLSDKSIDVTGLESRRIKQRDETLEWISRFAAPEFQRAWREARFNGPPTAV